MSPGNVVPRRYTGGFEHGRIVALACRAQPGVWFELACGLTRAQAAKRAARVRGGSTSDPVGMFEARREQRDSGLFAVQVRYVKGDGEQVIKPDGDRP